MKNQSDEQNNQFQDNSSLHRYRTELPNIIWHLGLDPFALALYAYYKKVAGDNGQCFQNNKNIAQATGMSISTMTARRRLLTKPHEILDGKSLITITERFKANGEADTTLIEINDIWPENIKKLSSMFSGNRGLTPKNRGVPPENSKEEHIEEELKEELFVAEDPRSSPEKILIKKGDQKTEEVTQSDLLRIALFKKKSWNTDEILYAWNVLADYGNVVNDWFRFIEGTIEKYRMMEKSKKASTKGRKSCSKTQTDLENYSEESSEKDTSGHHYPNSGEYLMKLLNESQNGPELQPAS